MTPTRAVELASPAAILQVNMFGTVNALEWARTLPGGRSGLQDLGHLPQLLPLLPLVHCPHHILVTFFFMMHDAGLQLLIAIFFFKFFLK